MQLLGRGARDFIDKIMNMNTLRRTGLLAAFLGAIAAAALLTIDLSAPQGPVSMVNASELPRPKVRSSYSPKNQTDDAQARYEYEQMRLRDPSTGRIPADIRSKELAFVMSLPRAEEIAAKTGRLMAEQWSFRGPTNVGGRTRALAVDLDYDGASNRRLLAGGISGGMYLSEDDGQSWSLRTSLADVASVTSLAQDPSNRAVWYYGTGEFRGNSAGGGLQEFYGQGIFKSTDSGRTWSQLLSTRDGKPNQFDSFFDFVWNLAVHPSGGTVFAATYGGVQKSTDGGTSWEFVLGREAENEPFNSTVDVVIASDGDIFATLSRSGSGASRYGVFKSSDLGTQWQDISPPGLANDPYRMVVAAAASDANILYLLVQTNQQGAVAGDHQLFRYDDGSGTWVDLSGAIPNEQGAVGNASFSTQGGYDQIVKVKPDDANTVFIGGTNLYRSTDGGNSFTRIGGYSSPANYGQFANHHSDQHSLVFLPTNPSVALSGSDGGVSKSADILAQPHSWTSLNNGYVTTQFYTVAMDPQAGGTSILGGLQDNGSWGTQEAAGASAWLDLFGGDGAHAAVAPGATAFFLSSQNGNTFR
ncbi:MAG: glycoside hydrolase, partial [Rhodothermia bacterium]|nr:glycoside hydrolase [Rhodothermia bacterium]